MTKKEGAHSKGKSNHAEASLRKENKPSATKAVVKGLGGIKPDDDPNDRNASTRAGVRANEEAQKKGSGAHDLGKSNHAEATTRADRLPKPIDPNKVVKGLSDVKTNVKK